MIPPKHAYARAIVQSGLGRLPSEMVLIVPSQANRKSKDSRRMIGSPGGFPLVHPIETRYRWVVLYSCVYVYAHIFVHGCMLLSMLGHQTVNSREDEGNAHP